MGFKNPPRLTKKMKKLILIAIIILLKISILQAQTSYAKKILDFEKQNGFTVNKAEYLLLDSIYNSINSKVKFPTNITKEQAIVICKKISKFIEVKYKFTYAETQIFSHGLQNRELDCNCNSMIFYDILNKEHNYKVYPVLAPGHMFIRWQLPNGTFFNYETTSKKVMTNEEYISAFNISKQSINNKTFLNNISEQELLLTNYVEITTEKWSNNKVVSKDMEVLSNKALLLNPNSYFAQILKAKIHIAQNEPLKGLEYLNRIQERDTLNYDISQRIAHLYSSLDKHDLSIKYFNKAIRINPNDPRLYAQRSFEYLRVNNVDKAMNDFDLASEKLKLDNVISFIFDYSMLSYLEKEIMDKYLEMYDK